ncbi:MAG: PDZ domain-containing protein [Bacteriovoracaceae bacterium]
MIFNDLEYNVEINDPKTHIVKVKLSVKLPSDFKLNRLAFYLPSWSPGSYLMREYARNLRAIRAYDQSGVDLWIEKKAKSIWEVDFIKLGQSQKVSEISLQYEIYCHELSVRTSYINENHAFLHGPTYLMGILDSEIVNPILKIKFPSSWQKISTGLKDISTQRSEFVYGSINYDELIDAPIEIGNQITDGFNLKGRDHFLCYYGSHFEAATLPGSNLKQDIKKIVEVVSRPFGDTLPYDNYTFIFQFLPRIYGGLEHLNSTAIHFDGMTLAKRQDYVSFLALVAHEYFHTWNVKRIRPKVLGPFNYLEEGYTSLLWLAEGLTSFMDELFVYRASLCTLDEYLNMQKDNLKKYLSIPGKKFQSLHDSSFDAWIKLYRPDENSFNTTMSYYLKGGIVFFCFNIMLVEQGKNIDDFLKLLWKRYLDNPKVGMDETEVFELIEKMSDKKTREKMEEMVNMTSDIDLEDYCKRMGLRFKWSTESKPYLGIQTEIKDGAIFISQVTLDGPGYKSGLNAGDEIIAINGWRVTRDSIGRINDYLALNKTYPMIVSRLGVIQELQIHIDGTPRELEKIEIVDINLVNTFLVGR